MRTCIYDVSSCQKSHGSHRPPIKANKSYIYNGHAWVSSATPNDYGVDSTTLSDSEKWKFLILHDNNMF